MTALPTTPAQFDARCREIEGTYPDISLISGHKSLYKALRSGSNDSTLHTVGMTRVYEFDGPKHPDDIQAIIEHCTFIGLDVDTIQSSTGILIRVSGKLSE